MDWQEFINQYWALLLIIGMMILPAVYIGVTELLDLIFNKNKLNKLLKHSDNFDVSILEQQLNEDETKQRSFEKSHLLELERQINY